MAETLTAQFDIALADPPPTALYTIARASVGEYRFQSHERYAHVVLGVEPYAGSNLYHLAWELAFADDTSRAIVPSIPSEYAPLMFQTIRDIVYEWQQVRYPIINIRVVFLRGSWHVVNSSEYSYRQATRRAFIDAVERVGLMRIP